jgi:hypothetical protein
MRNFYFSMPKNVTGRTKQPTAPKRFVFVSAECEKQARRKVAFEMGRGKCPAGVQLINVQKL